MIYPDWRDFAPERERMRLQHSPLVFTNGCYDLLHPGHLRTLAAARALGGALLVAINSDASVRASKGSSRPVMPALERAELLDALEFVDAVTVFDDPTPLALITALLPDVLVKGADWGPGAVVGEPEVLAAGGRVERIPLAPGFSTSALIARMRRH